MRVLHSTETSCIILMAMVRIAHGLQCPFAHLHTSRGTKITTPPLASPLHVAASAPPAAAAAAFSYDYSNMDGSLALSPIESWAYMRLEASYAQALAIKCPFFRRRASDVLDSAEMILRFLLIRHKSLISVPPPMAWRCTSEACLLKNVGISLEEARQVILDDWRITTRKGYYITGRLNTTIYRDDCLFDGPDPDMPVQGLRKYLNAASQLFDQGKSRAELLSLEIAEQEGDDTELKVIVAKWRMNGVLRLPWKPKLPNWTGTTIYYFDEDGLIYKHEETWDMSVAQAFLRTLLPSVAKRIWSDNDNDLSPSSNPVR